MQPITIVQGGQWGSEAKGAVTGIISLEHRSPFVVRTGATNAGHTVYYKGRPVKMQQLPVGWVNPNAMLVLGPGTLIDPDILRRECDLVTSLTGEDIRRRLIIDHNAGLHLPVHAERSHQANRHVKIGATGKGCSEALVDRIKGRGEGYATFGRSEFKEGYTLDDTSDLLNTVIDNDAKVIIEGTQGTLLDLYTGPYPYTTHKSTLTGNWLAEAGLSSSLPQDVVMVLRTYPIRVAGNSGPMPREVSWYELACTLNYKREKQGLPPLVSAEALAEFRDTCYGVDDGFPHPAEWSNFFQHKWAPGDRVTYRDSLSKFYPAVMNSLSAGTYAELIQLFELTTVTLKLRRIAELDTNTTARAMKLVRPDRIAVTFMNYEFPHRWFEKPSTLSEDEKFYLRKKVSPYLSNVAYLGYGPEPHHFMVQGQDF